MYGSAVEEFFSVTGDGLQTDRLAYAEPRLAEFYGHEDSRHENGLWVVAPECRRIETLRLRVSPDSFMELSLDSRPIPLRELVEPGDAVSIGVASCPRGSDGR
jgi:hypothetical protein